MHVPTRDFRKSGGGVHLDLETEMPGVELDRAIHVVYDVAEARGHRSFLSFLGCCPPIWNVPVSQRDATGQNEKPRFSALCQLPPAAEIRSHEVMNEKCHTTGLMHRNK
jgi:hypothetical protein